MTSTPRPSTYRACTLALLVATGLGCSAPMTAPDYVDLVASAGLVAPSGPAESTECLCADESWNAVAMADGDVLTTEIALQRRPVLTLSGCVEAPEGASPGGHLDCLVEAGSEKTVEVPLGDSAVWWDLQIDLSELSGRTAALRLEAALPGTSRLWLRKVEVLLRYSS